MFGKNVTMNMIRNDSTGVDVYTQGNLRIS